MTQISKPQRTQLDANSLLFFLKERPTLATKFLDQCNRLDFYTHSYDDRLDLYALMRAVKNQNKGWDPSHLMPFLMSPDENNRNSVIRVITAWYCKNFYINSMHNEYSDVVDLTNATEVKFYSKLYGPGVDWHVSVVFTFNEMKDRVEKILIKHMERDFNEQVPVYVYAYDDELRLTYVSGDIWLDIDVVGLFKEIGYRSSIAHVNADGYGDFNESRILDKDVVTVFDRMHVREHQE
jgi:hypothetical protein